MGSWSLELHCFWATKRGINTEKGNCSQRYKKCYFLLLMFLAAMLIRQHLLNPELRRLASVSEEVFFFSFFPLVRLFSLRVKCSKREKFNSVLFVDGYCHRAALLTYRGKFGSLMSKLEATGQRNLPRHKEESFIVSRRKGNPSSSRWSWIVNHLLWV